MGRIFPRGHSCVPKQSHLFPNNARISERQDASKSAQILRNPSLTQKHRAEQCPNNFDVLGGDVLFCEFSQHRVDGKCADTCKDHLQSKMRVRNEVKLCKWWKKNRLHRALDGQSPDKPLLPAYYQWVIKSDYLG